ncbi:alpha/beta hydrolase [Roseateles sp. UC29_93]|uniref:alpha/beta hydrolase n=1 Tax=Roseateles sp. UC29_93 TaxID=3350177 RepID=UPI0036711A30
MHAIPEEGQASDRRDFLVQAASGAAALGLLVATGGAQAALPAVAGADNFYRSDKVTARKVVFKNQYKMSVAGNLFMPRALGEAVKAPALVVGHPMGAVKEQSANLYATKMAERGFVTLSLDLSFWVKAMANRATLSRRTSTPRISVLQWTSCAHRASSTASASAPSASAAAAASSSARPRSTRA